MIGTILNTDQNGLAYAMQKVDKASEAIADLIAEATAQQIPINDIERLIITPDVVLHEVALSRSEKEYEKTFSRDRLIAEMIANPQRIYDACVRCVIALSDAQLTVNDFHIHNGSVTLSDEAKQGIERRYSTWIANEAEAKRFEVIQRLADFANDIQSNHQEYGLPILDGSFRLLRWLESGTNEIFFPNTTMVKNPA